MFIVVVIKRETREVVAYFPMLFDKDVSIRSPNWFEHKDYIIEIFNNTDPIFVKNGGSLYLKTNTFIIRNLDD